MNDRHLIEELYREHRHVMYLTAYKILNNPQMAEDAVHDSFVRIIDMPKKFIKQSGPQTRSFCAIVCRNVSLNMLRKIGKFADFDDEKVCEICSEDSFEDDLLNKFEAEKVAKLIKTLPDIYKDALILYYYHGYRVRDIAKILNTTDEAVKKRLQRARAELGKKLTKEGARL